MTNRKRGRHGDVVGWVLLTLLLGGSLDIWLATHPWRPGDLLMPHERLPYGILVAAVTVLLAALQAQWLLGRARRRELDEQQARLATVVENASDAIIGESSDGRVVFWNLAAVRLFGHTEVECVGRQVVELLFPQGGLGSDGSTRAMFLGQAAMPAFDAVCHHRSGHPIDVSVAVSAIVTRDGQFAGRALHIRDISERKHHERQLLDLNARLEDTVRQRTLVLEKAEKDLRTVLDAVPAMIGYWDCDLFNRVANRAYHEGLGIEIGQMSGRSARELLGSELFERSRAHIEAVLRGEPQVFERSMKGLDGEGERRSLAHYIPDRQGDVILGFYAVVHDITEQHESHRRLTTALRENEALLQTIKTHSIYSVADLRGNIIDVNEGFCRISGYSRDELLGRNHHIVNSGTHSRKFWVEMWRCVSSGKAWRAEVCNRAKDGSPYWVDTIIAPFCGADGVPERFISMRHDITAAKRAAVALANERARLDNILRGTNVGTWEWNVQTGQARFDERWAQIAGCSLSDLMPSNIQTWRDQTHPDDVARSGALLERHFAGELPYYEVETRRRHADGRWIWVLDRGQVRTWTPEGKPEWMYGTHQDIQDRHAAEERLRDSEAFLERVGSVAGVGGWEYDVERALLSWTRQTRRISGVDDRYEPTLYKALAFYRGDSRAQMARAMHEAAESGRAFDLELAYRTAEGKHLWVRAVGEAQGEAYGVGVGPRRVVGAFQDITERRRSSEALLEAKAAAEAASAAKSAFLSNMSHEIRTPLNAVIGVTHLLADTAMDDDQKLLLSKAQLAGRALLGIVNDVLDLAKIEAGEIALDEGPYQPLALLGEIDAVYAPLARQKGLAFTALVAPDVPAWLQCDSTRLRQVLVNLVGNALKFTSVGGIQVELSSTDLSPDRCKLFVRVKDSGIGIDPDVQARLFSPFIQADVSTTRRYGGTGLGLSIVKRLAEIMGGEVGVNSALGVGSEFWFTVPQLMVTLDAAETVLSDETPDATDALWLADVGVLLVDDSDINLEVAKRLLERRGARVRTCTSGREALACLGQAPADFDAVLMDVQMPDMDGLEATRRIRSELGLKDLPVIALTAGALVEERRRALDAGMQGFLPKPLDPAQLIRMLRRFVEAARGAALPVKGLDTRPAPVTPAWLLIDGIDAADVADRLGHDGPLFVSMLRHLLEEFGDLMDWAGADLGSPAQRRALAARMHKLRGTAGNLGARELHRRATAAETSLRAEGTDANAVEIHRAVGRELSRLAAQVRRVLPVQEPIAGDEDQDGPRQALSAIAAAQMQALVQGLQRQDLAALQGFQRLEPALRGALGLQSTRAVGAALESLEFSCALDLLTRGLPPKEPAESPAAPAAQTPEAALTRPETTV